MTILLGHNYYQYPGGEDVVYRSEVGMLEANGHRVIRYSLTNDVVKTMGLVRLGASTIWNQGVYRALRKLIREEKVDVCHFHNTFPLMSPSAYYAGSHERTPIVQTLHNFRLMCPSATMFRDGGTCEECLGRSFPWDGLLHACYRDSRLVTGTVGAMLAIHRAAGTWTEIVSQYIALTPFARDKFIQGGLPARKIVVKPNFLSEDPGAGSGNGGYALFIGRLTPEKGIGTLLRAWTSLSGRIPLKIAGTGPLAPDVASAATQIPGVEYLGQVSSSEACALLGRAVFVVIPSEWYEGAPMAVLEAFARGTPVIASNLGGLASMINHGSTGLHFRPGNADDLSQRVCYLWSDPDCRSRMRVAARLEYEAKYTAAANYRMTNSIYASLRVGRPLAGVLC
ncbi:MAG: kanE 3 [Bryobacterales bacterium]|nr:kanE 3 [Bryobacterales bacterium]